MQYKYYIGIVDRNVLDGGNIRTTILRNNTKFSAAEVQRDTETF